MKRRIYHIAALGSWLLAFSLLAVSCADDIPSFNPPEGGKNGQPITFTVDDSQDWMMENMDAKTRGALADGAYAPKVIPMCSENGLETGMYVVTSVVNGIHSSKMTETATRGAVKTSLDTNIGISAYSYTDTWGSQAPDMFYNEEASRVGNTNTWSFVSPQFWPTGEKTVRFFAYAPYQATNQDGIASGSGITLSSSTYNGSPTIDFEVNKDIASQIDLMTAASDPMLYRTSLQAYLPFKHALTCVKFVLGKGLQGQVKTISLTNIVRTGTYTFDYLNPCWAPGTNKHTFTVGNLNLASNSENTVVISDDGENASTLLMIPQTFTSDDQKVELVYLGDDNHQHTIVAPLKGTTWLPGTTVTYKLSADVSYDYILEATPIMASNGGGELAYKITSYKQSSEGEPEAVPWRIVGYSVDDGETFVPTKPDTCYWAEVATTSGKGGTTPENGRVYLQVQNATRTSTLTAAQDTELQIEKMCANAPAPEGRGTYANPFDLSMHDLTGKETGIRNTANCYIVNAPGNYSLPLIYGNAVTNGRTNSQAYTGSLNTDYLGNNITSPNIWDDTDGSGNHYEIGDAVLVWQDAPNLVTNVRLDSEKRNLCFTISRDHISQGNAVVAVRDNNATPRIMWSWHIWVTAQNVMSLRTFTNEDKRTYRLMPLFLGWTSKGGTLSEYAGRSLMVMVQQDNGKTATFTISQQNGINFEGKHDGYASFYQWGRKDPLPPGKNTRYYESPNGFTFETVSGYSISNSIQNPSKHYSNQTFPNSYKNAWCVNGVLNPSSTYKVVKTIYDPCPPGFHVAEINVLKGIGDSRSKGFTKGWEYYTDDGMTTMYFPAQGRMDLNGSMSLVGTNCNVWLGGMASTTGAYIIYSTSSAHDNYRNDGSPGYGRCVIAVQDY